AEPERRVLADRDEVAVLEGARRAVVEALAVQRPASGVEPSLEQEYPVAQDHPAVRAADAGRLVPNNDVLVRSGTDRDPAALDLLRDRDGVADLEACRDDDLNARE